MHSVKRQQFWNKTRHVRVAAIFALGLAIGGCSSASSIIGSSSSSSNTGSDSNTQGSTSTSGKPTSFTDRINSLFLGSSSKSADTKTASNAGTDTANTTLDCPTATVRDGASTLAVQSTPGDTSPTNLRYQASIADIARECVFRPTGLTIKVGVQGRIILGPTGEPGSFDVPMRIALVQEGPDPKTLWTKLYRVPVIVPAGQSNVPFVQIEEDLTVPKPKGSDLDAYVVYVGFDSEGLKEQKPEKKKPPRKH